MHSKRGLLDVWTEVTLEKVLKILMLYDQLQHPKNPDRARHFSICAKSKKYYFVDGRERTVEDVEASRIGLCDYVVEGSPKRTTSNSRSASVCKKETFSKVKENSSRSDAKGKVSNFRLEVKKKSTCRSVSRESSTSKGSCSSEALSVVRSYRNESKSNEVCRSNRRKRVVGSSKRGHL